MAQEKQKIIEDIIGHEWEMFSTVNEQASADPFAKKRPSCRDFPEEFRIHRTSKLQAWSLETLQSYLEDITAARVQGRNLMTYKYARMDNLIPSENQSPLIGRITTDLVEWQKAFMDAYPGIMAGGRALQGSKPGTDWASFENYLRCELETYSEKTLQHLMDDIAAMRAEGRTMSEAIYTYLVRKKGYASLEDAETKALARGNHPA